MIFMLKLNCLQDLQNPKGSCIFQVNYMKIIILGKCRSFVTLKWALGPLKIRAIVELLDNYENIISIIVIIEND